MEYKRLLGEWTVESTVVEVYECRYSTPKNRIRICLFHKPNNPDEQPKQFGLDLSTNIMSSTLEPGEFSIRNYGDTKDIIKQMEGFPEFEKTKKRSLIRQPSDGPLHVCPIWRLRSYDCIPDDDEIELSVREGGIVTTSVAECTFEEIKRMVKKVPTNAEIAEHLVLMNNFEDTFIGDCISDVVDSVIQKF